MAKFHLYNIKGEYKLFEEDLIEDAIKTKEWFKTKAEALKNDVKDIGEKVIESIKGFTDEEILKEAELRGLIEKDASKILLNMDRAQIKYKYTIEELKEIGRNLGMRFKSKDKEDEIIDRILEKIKG